MTDLGPDDFSEFFRAVHGVSPFPWQQHLAKKVLKDGRWPSVIDLPTAAGKTAVIDIAIFHLACEADRGEARSAPMRMVFVIDRRIVVDAAFDRARKIAERLRTARDGVLVRIRDRLGLLAGPGAPPLTSVRLRGGVPQERDWARSTAQPLVVVSTVDQAGSRLLFRGYGVSPGMLPVHAGLLGSDALWFLDEVHLSRPFEETLATISEGHVRQMISKVGRLAPFAVVRLSATPGGDRPPDAFPETGFDLRNNAPVSFLRRMDARKPTDLVEAHGDYPGIFAFHALRFAGLSVSAPEDSDKTRKRTKVTDPKECGDIALPPVVRRVAVVVNRVDLARLVFERIVAQSGEEAQVALLIGRIRPLDRERLLSRIEPFFANEGRPMPAKPLILVATQTIEAGADLDVDALVTEVAPLDCLRQRFGRLDRLGLRGTSPGVIIYPPGHPPSVEGKSDSPWVPIRRIYGEAAWRTSKFLSGLGSGLDLGVGPFQHHLDKLTAGGPSGLLDLLAPQLHAPVLLPPYADMWAMTRPAPATSPEVSLFLHGPETSPDVEIVWRADIDLDDTDAALLSLDLCPPSSLEALSVPIWVARRWLEGQIMASGAADVPERGAPDTDIEPRSQHRMVLRWRAGKWKVDSVKELIPGDLVVIPSAFGGCDAWGWNPESPVEAADLGTEANYVQRARGVLRITPTTLQNAWIQEGGNDTESKAGECWAQISMFIEQQGDDIDSATLCRFLQEGDRVPPRWRNLLAAMDGHHLTLQFYHEGDRGRGFILLAEDPLESGLLSGEGEVNEDGVESITGQEDSSSIGAEVTLSDHHSHVAERAKDLSVRSGLSEAMVNLVTLAGSLHDLGKADPRFQADLRGASTLLARDPELAAALLPVGELIAKSATLSAPRQWMISMRRASPEGFRHEALSVALAEKHMDVIKLQNADRDLVLWLIGTHHGYGRPFFPPYEDPLPQTEVTVTGDGWSVTGKATDAPIRLDQGWFDRVLRLNRQYGPWELARLEAILRLADHAASALERRRSA
jgi:CRISPR-associated endonuclease/helicase Cas3